MKMAIIPFGGGGGGGRGRAGVSEEIETLGEAPPHKLRICAVFLFHDPPSPSFWICP